MKRMLKTMGTPILLVLLLTTTIFATTSPKIRINNQDLGVSAVNDDGRVLVPLRAIFEALDATVGYDSETKTISGNQNGKMITLTVNEKEAFVDGTLVILDTPAKIIDGKTLVPVRFIGESLGAKVDWKDSTVIIGLEEPVEPEKPIKVEEEEVEEEIGESRVDLDDPKMSEKYDAAVFGTFVHPFSYDHESQEYYTYILRGVGNRFGEIKPCDIPEDMVFTKSMSVYYALKPNGYFDGRDVTMADLEVYQKATMEFTKEKPYWVEKVTFKQPAKDYGIFFYIITNILENEEASLSNAQEFHFQNGGAYTGTAFSTEAKNKHIPLSKIFDNELIHLKHYRTIYDNHGLHHSQTTGFGNWMSPIKLMSEDQELMYYNVINSEDFKEDGAYTYNKTSGKSKKITDGWIHDIDENYIYYISDPIMRCDKDGNNKTVLYPIPGTFNMQYFTTMYLEGDYLYAYSRSTPGQIWKMRKDGSNAKVILEYGNFQDGFAVSADHVFFALEDGIYQSTLDGSNVTKIVDGDYKILYLNDGYLYYRVATDFSDYTEDKIKVK